MASMFLPESGVRQIKFDAIPRTSSNRSKSTRLSRPHGCDGIGGSINLVTKTARERPTVSVSGMGGYTPILGGRNLVETAGISANASALRKFGLLVGGTYDWNGRGIDDIEPVPDIATLSVGQPLAILRLSTFVNIVTTAAVGDWPVAATTNWATAPISTCIVSIRFSQLWRSVGLFFYGQYAGILLTVQTVARLIRHGSDCTACTGTPSFGDQIRRPDYAIGSLLLGGKHVLTTTWYAWDISASRSSQVGQVGDRSASFGSNSHQQLPIRFGKYQGHLHSSVDACLFHRGIHQPDTMLFTRMQINHGLTAQLNLQFAGAMAKRYHLGSHTASIEVGGNFATP